MTPKTTLTLFALAALSGCTTSSLSPMDPSALPARHPLRTAGGYQLELDADGTLTHRPAQDDIEAALGATLVAGAGGLTVANRLSGDSPLLPGDVLLKALPRHPGSLDFEGYVAKVEADVERLEAELEGEGAPYGEYMQAAMRKGMLEAGESDVAPLSSALLVRDGHALRQVADLDGYALTWTALDLLVERQGEAEPVPVRIEVGKPEPTPHRLWHPNATRRLGFEAVQVDSLPPYLLPERAKAGRGDLLVTWVAVDSPLALEGLRPLCLIRRVGTEEGELYDEHRVLTPDGERFELVIGTPDHPIDLELLFVLADIESDATRTYVNVGPLGAAFAYASAYTYNPRTDRYAKSSGWSVGKGTFGSAGSSGDGRGASSSMWLGLNPGALDTEVDRAEGTFGMGPFLFSWNTDDLQSE
jgi:hypothetical protein